MAVRKPFFNKPVMEMGCVGITDQGEKILGYFKDGHDIIKLRDELIAFRGVLKMSGLDPDFAVDYGLPNLGNGGVDAAFDGLWVYGHRSRHPGGFECRIS